MKIRGNNLTSCFNFCKCFSNRNVSCDVSHQSKRSWVSKVNEWEIISEILNQHAKSFQTSYCTHLRVSERFLCTDQVFISTKKSLRHFQMCAIARLKAFGMLIQDITSDCLIIYFGDSKSKKEVTRYLGKVTGCSFWKESTLTGFVSSRHVHNKFVCLFTQ